MTAASDKAEGGADTAGELLPCPFCGGVDIRIDAHGGGGVSSAGYRYGAIYSMCCYQCGATFPNRYQRELMVEQWNRRTPAPAANGPVENHGWLPIESAPKDGTDILIWCAPWSCGSEARYIEDEGWWLANNHPTDHWGDQKYPTHWQPIPVAPGAISTPQPGMVTVPREPKEGLLCGDVAVSTDPRYAGFVFVRHVDGKNWTTCAKMTPETWAMLDAAMTDAKGL